jgi:hypothetical protein
MKGTSLFHCLVLLGIEQHAHQEQHQALLLKLLQFQLHPTMDDIGFNEHFQELYHQTTRETYLTRIFTDPVMDIMSKRTIFQGSCL